MGVPDGAVRCHLRCPCRLRCPLSFALGLLLRFGFSVVGSRAGRDESERAREIIEREHGENRASTQRATIESIT